MSGFQNLRIADNFYQTSLFFPMTTVAISALCKDGTTTLVPYSLVQPCYVAGKDFYAIRIIECTWVRELDNTQNKQPGNLNGRKPPYHEVNGITSRFGAHFGLKGQDPHEEVPGYHHQRQACQGKE